MCPGRCHHQQAALREGVCADRHAGARAGDAGACPDLRVRHAPVHVPDGRPPWIPRGGGSRRGHPRRSREVVTMLQVSRCPVLVDQLPVATAGKEVRDLGR